MSFSEFANELENYRRIENCFAVLVHKKHSKNGQLQVYGFILLTVISKIVFPFFTFKMMSADEVGFKNIKDHSVFPL